MSIVLNGTTGINATGTVYVQTPFYENVNTLTANYTIQAGRNAMTIGPVTFADGVVITVQDGAVWSIV